jgi:hypothetical protein
VCVKEIRKGECIIFSYRGVHIHKERRRCGGFVNRGGKRPPTQSHPKQQRISTRIDPTTLEGEKKEGEKKKEREKRKKERKKESERGQEDDAHTYTYT